MSRLLALWRPDSFVTSYLPVVLRSGIIGLLGMFQKVYSLAAQSFRMRKKVGFPTGLRPVLGKLLASWGGLLKTLQFVRSHFWCVRANERPTGLKFVLSCAYEGSTL